MAKKEFQAESKRLMELVIHSIYTNKEIFLRELISNASDATDKMYYTALTDENLTFSKEDYSIRITPNKEQRTLTISDRGIGMDRDSMDSNLGIIAKSGTLEFKQKLESADENMDIIGQFGIGFYSSFLVSKEVEVLSKAFGSDVAYRWISDGVDGYEIEETTKDTVGTDIILHLRDNTEDEDFDSYLEEYTLKNLVKKYSNYIRYPIHMEVTKRRAVEVETPEGEEPKAPEYESYTEDETLNSMIPIWKKNKSELTDEDYNNFYQEKHFGFDQPLAHIHFSAEGNLSYKTILYIPGEAPYNYYTQNYEKGLELYSSGVLIMEQCGELLPDHYSFVKGVVDSEDLSLNVSREILQHDRQLKAMAKRIESKVSDELKDMLENDREKYEKFFDNFGIQLKAGIYSSYGMEKDKLQDFLLYYSSLEKKLVTLKEYISRMPEDQKYIYYAAGDSIDRIDKLPQAESVKDKGYEILYMTHELDEFVIKMLMNYDEKEFRSIASGDLGIEDLDDTKEKEESTEEEKAIFDRMKDILGDKVVAVRESKRLKKYPVCFAAQGDLSIEMEKTLNAMPNAQRVQAQKILELNSEHPFYARLKEYAIDNEAKFKLYTEVLYDQACMIEGLPIEDPIAFSNKISELM